MTSGKQRSMLYREEKERETLTLVQVLIYIFYLFIVGWVLGLWLPNFMTTITFNIATNSYIIKSSLIA